MKRLALPLLTGLSLGAAAFLAWRFFVTPTVVAPAPARQPNLTWSWRDQPGRLPADYATAAIAAWRELRAPDGSPADNAARSLALRALLLRLPSSAYPDFIASLPRPDTETHRRQRQLAYDAWTELDAPVAARWAIAAGREFRDLARQATRAWAALDPHAAAAWACTLTDPRMLHDPVRPTLEALAKVDPSRALELVRSCDDKYRAHLFGAVVNIVGQADPANTLQNLPAEVWRDGAGFDNLRDTLRVWAKRDPAAALAWLAKQPNRDVVGGPASWVPQLAESPDQLRTLGALIVADPDFPDRVRTLGRIVLSMTDSPEAGLAWLSAHTDPTLRVDALHELLGSVGLYGPGLGDGSSANRFLPFALALPPSQLRSRVLGDLLAAWFQKDPAAASTWTSRQNDPGVVAASAQIQARQLAEIAAAEPATALEEWARLSDPRVRLGTINSIAEAWGKTDPVAALRWQTEQTTALGSPDAAPSYTLLQSWAKKDPDAALRWTETLLASRTDDEKARLVRSLLSALAGPWDEPRPRAETADLYSKFQDPALRAKVLSDHIRDWMTYDPPAAKAWLEKSDALTPEQAAALLAAPAP